MDDKITKLKDLIDNAKNIVFFGGAGVSTESGIPDFRSKDGLYNKKDVNFEKYHPEYLLSHTCIEREPEVFYEFYRQKMDTRGIEPNAAHYYLAELEKSGKNISIVTQNIDGLHQKAGSRNVFEVHGTTQRNYCVKCGKSYPSDYIFKSKEPMPKCVDCGGMVRCDVVLYEEMLPEAATEGAINAISNADLLIIGGTSLVVYPAASFVRFFKGQNIVVINLEHLAFPRELHVTLEINEKIGETFKKLRSI